MSEFTMLGWREWAALPDINIKAIKVKVDTGAKTSALHASHLEEFEKNGEAWVRFTIRPDRKMVDHITHGEAKIVDRRNVRDSGGHVEERIVIKTNIHMAEESWAIEITLTNREDMQFRMLLGRTAMHKRFVCNPTASFACGGNTARPPASLTNSL